MPAVVRERERDYASIAVAMPCRHHGCRTSFNALANAADVKTATPIKHIVIIFGENVSFDHYFGAYMTASPHIDSAVRHCTSSRIFPLLCGAPASISCALRASSSGSTVPTSVVSFRLSNNLDSVPSLFALTSTRKNAERKPAV